MFYLNFHLMKIPRLKFKKKKLIQIMISLFIFDNFRGGKKMKKKEITVIF